MAGVGASGYKRFSDVAIISKVCGHAYTYALEGKKSGHAFWIDRYENRPCVSCLSAAHQREWEAKQARMFAEGWTYSQARLQFERVVDGAVQIEQA